METIVKILHRSKKKQGVLLNGQSGWFGTGQAADYRCYPEFEWESEEESTGREEEYSLQAFEGEDRWQNNGCVDM